MILIFFSCDSGLVIMVCCKKNSPCHSEIFTDKIICVGGMWAGVELKRTWSWVDDDCSGVCRVSLHSSAIFV